MQWVSNKKQVETVSRKATKVIFQAFDEFPEGTIARGSCSCVKIVMKRDYLIVSFSPSFPNHLPGTVHKTTKKIIVSYPDGNTDELIIVGTVNKN